jgi:hypothetical protein
MVFHTPVEMLPGPLPHLPQRFEGKDWIFGGPGRGIERDCHENHGRWFSKNRLKLRFMSD